MALNGYENPSIADTQVETGCFTSKYMHITNEFKSNARHFTIHNSFLSFTVSF